MITNHEILYTIQMRNEACTAVRQLSADLQAQGSTLKQVARALGAVQAQAARMGTATPRRRAAPRPWPTASRRSATRPKGVTAFTKAMCDALSKASGFGGLTKALDDLDRVFRTSQGMTVYKARLQSLQAVLAALLAQFVAAQAA